MKIFKLTLSLALTISLVYCLNRSWDFGNPIPPLGKFLDPFHGFWQNAERNLPSKEELTIPGLKDEVTIVYDSAFIPHIFARNEEDLFFAQGYITARDRLWQMEFQVLAAAGRISEVIGEKALNFDRYQRRIGMGFGAENTLKGIQADPEVMSSVSSYTKGVNAYIATLNYSSLPLEYKLLDYSPEAWSDLKVGLFFMNMAKTLNSDENDLQNTNLLRMFGKETVDLLFPDCELATDPVVDNPGGWKFTPVKVNDSVPLAIPNELVGPKNTTERPKGIGSNNWVVGGTRTSTGSPIVCNDPHLNLSMPSLWHIVHLNAPGINAMGAAFPGSPAVILGFNDSIAWGCTNATRDLVDWYKIQFKDASKKEYLSDGKWKSAQKRIEKISIKGKDAYYDTVTYTHHGPVVYDDSFKGTSERINFAYRWISHDESNPLKVFYKLDHAGNYDDYSEALNNFYSPAQNFVFGSVSGDIAVRAQGKFPVRRKDEGKFLLDGTKTSSEWQTYIPMDQNIGIKNPPKDYLFSANQYPVDETYPYYVRTGSYFETYRNRRINQVLAGLPKATVEDMMKLHNDNYNWQAFESLPLMLSQLDSTHFSADEAKVFESLKHWDHFNSIESEAAIYYEQWWRIVYATVWDELDNDKITFDRPSEYVTIRFMKERPDFSFFDIQNTPEKETAREVIGKSFSQSVAANKKWQEDHKGKVFQWANFKDTYVQHLLRIPALSYHAINGGNGGIVNASRDRTGPSWRMIVSLEKSGVKAWGVYPGGQSGNPGSPHYNNFLGLWEKGEYLSLKFVNSIDAITSKAVMITNLKPE